MKKNLLDTQAKQELIQRISRLKPDSKNLWGKMNVNQMLKHCTDGIAVAYGDVKVTPKKTGWFHNKMVRFFILHTDVQAPKEKTPTYPELNMVERGIDPGNFEQLQKDLIKAVESFPAKQTLAVHPFLGNFSDANWARMMYTHLIHHLEQFGV